jgi:glycogen synthase
VSHYTASQTQRRYRVDESKLRVVHNAVTRSEQLAQLRTDKKMDEPIVLFLGRVTFQKGPDYFLEAPRASCDRAQRQVRHGRAAATCCRAWSSAPRASGSRATCTSRAS